VYVANAGSTSVSGYTVDSGGSLKNVPSSPFAAGTNPTEVTVDPTSKFVYVTNYSSGNVSAYAIAGNGALTQLAGSPFAAGTAPVGIATCSVTAGKCLPPPL
jgi:6-phosphogluconolactonase (cycloisomerase 2 family)